MKALILAGGFGTRLRSVVHNMPKPLAPIKDQAFIEILINNLLLQGIEKVYLSLHYQKEKFEEYFKGHYLADFVEFIYETEPLGTGGAIKFCLEKIASDDENILVLNGDTYVDFEVTDLSSAFENSQSPVSVLLSKVENVSRYGEVKIQEESIVEFCEKSEEKRSGFINAGVYLVWGGALKSCKEKKFSFEKDYLEKNIEILKPSFAISSGYFIDIGVPDDYRKAQDDLAYDRSELTQKALFLDRDGVINVDHGHVYKVEDFDFIDEIIPLCLRAQEKGYLIVVVTNQAGIAKGYYSEDDFLCLTEWMTQKFLEAGVVLSRTYYCPYHVDAVEEKYRRNSFFRKPYPGMLLKAIKEYKVNPVNSILVGDKVTDMMAGSSAKIGLLVEALGSRIETKNTEKISGKNYSSLYRKLSN